MLKYFSYGSNMSTLRLKARVPSARVIGVYELPFHRLAFHLSSKDGSGKCDAFFTQQKKDKVIGVLFHIESQHKISLDTVEGLGFTYDIKLVTVTNRSGQSAQAFTYIAREERIDATKQPYTWYKNHVLIGALENSLPTDYVDTFIRYIPAEEDIDQARHNRELAIHNGLLPSVDRTVS